jgi:hypothetical protein
MSGPASINLKLSAVPQLNPDTFKRYPDIFQDLAQLHNAVRYLQQALDEYTQSIFTAYCTVNIPAGSMVNVVNSGGATSARLADASVVTKPTMCFALASYNTGDQGQFQTIGVNPYINGLTPGTLYYLSDTTPGNITAVAPVGAGKLKQSIGFSINSTTIMFFPSLVYKEL